MNIQKLCVTSISIYKLLTLTSPRETYDAFPLFENLEKLMISDFSSLIWIQYAHHLSKESFGNDEKTFGDEGAPFFGGDVTFVSLRRRNEKSIRAH